MMLDLDMEVEREGFLASCRASFGPGLHLVSGPVGSGKSTIALALASLLPFRGRRSMEGVDGSLLSFQFPEHQVTASRLDGEVRSWGLEPDDILPGLGLGDRPGTDPLRLSRGTLKALNLACILARDPDLLILDEPFGSLDCVAKGRLCRALEARRGITLVFSHERAMLPAADSLSHMRAGTLTQLGHPREAMGSWDGAPSWLREALRRGAEPDNLRLEDVMEAICAMRG